MPWYLWIMIGIIIGSVITNIIYLSQCRYGEFQIDRSNPEKDICRMVAGDIDKIYKKRYLFLKINKHADLSQK